MTYKIIMVHAGVDPAAEARLRAALDLGRQHQATILGVGAVAWDPYIDPALGYADGATIQALRDAVDLDIEAARMQFAAVCAAYPHPTPVAASDRLPGQGHEQPDHRHRQQHRRH